jgi:hypothetical protein
MFRETACRVSISSGSPSISAVFPDFDDKIVSLYARGMSTREIAGHLHDLYGIDVSPGSATTTEASEPKTCNCL